MGSFWRTFLFLVLLCAAVVRADSDPYAGLGVYDEHPPRRVAVFVLSYADKWLSYAGEALYSFTLQNRTFQKYDKVFVVRGKSMTEDSIRVAMRKALDTGKIVDLFISSHSGASGFKIAAEDLWVTPVDALYDLTEKDKPQLGLAAHFGCNNVYMADAFVKELGFKSFVGHDGTSVGALALDTFLEGWLGCEELVNVIGDANDDLHERFTYDLPKYLYKKFSGRSDYNAVMMGFGQNQRLCNSEEKRWKHPF